MAIAVTALTWPFLEVLPMVTTIGATGVALLAVGLMLRDGVFLLMGYVLAAGITGAAIWAVLTVT